MRHTLIPPPAALAERVVCFWITEQDEAPAQNRRYRHIVHLGELPDIIREIG